MSDGLGYLPVVLAATVVWASCSPTDSGASTTVGPATTPTASTNPTPTPEPSTSSVAEPPATSAPESGVSSEAEKFGRVVVLAEEFMLADVLSLGLQPIASSATVHDAGFQGLDDFATNSIEILPMTTLSLERLAALRPDTIITSDFWAEQTDTKILDGIAARTISVSDRLSASDRIVELGDALGRQAEAASLVAEFDIVVASAREALKADECVITVATVYPGPRLATFIEPIWDIPGSAPSDPMLETISLQE